ncbi:MAG: hypothetical protein ACE5JL_09295, partial [Dehalococcoidia bacterium]
MKIRRSLLRFLFFFAALAVAMAACGGGDGDGEVSATATPVPPTATPEPPTPTTVPPTPPPTGPPEVFNTAQPIACSVCHSLDGTVGLGPTQLGIATRAATRVPGLSAEEYI